MIPSQRKMLLKNGGFKTGDLGKIGENEELYFSGKIKNMIILGNGENVSAEYLEEIFLGCSYVKGVKALTKEYQITLKIIPDWNIENVKGMIKHRVDQANQNLPSAWRICHIVYMDDDFERTSIGKIK